MEKLLPMNIEYEQGVLGSIIIDPDAIIDVADILTPEDFYRDAHRTIYTAIMYLYERREPADYLTICDHLEQRGKLEEVGGASYINSLIYSVPTSANASFYAEKVTQLAEYRHLIETAGKIAALAYEQADDALQQAETLILRIGQKRRRSDFVSIEEYMPTYLDRLERIAANQGKVRGIPTGFTDIDAVLGGLQRGGLYIPAARPGIGKTTLVQNIAYNAAIKHNHRVGFFSLEMSLDDLMDRFVSMHTGIDSQNLRNSTLTDAEYHLIVQGNLERLGIYLNHTPAITISDLQSKARRLIARHNIDLLIIDYLQLMRATIDGKRVTPREMEVAEIARALKALAGELNVPVLAPAQINREIEHRPASKEKHEEYSYRMPVLSDLRESGELEQSADVVMFLARAEEDEKHVRLFIAKHRNGPRGELDLYFKGETTRFYSLGEHD